MLGRLLRCLSLPVALYPRIVWGVRYRITRLTLEDIVNPVLSGVYKLKINHAPICCYLDCCPTMTEPIEKVVEKLFNIGPCTLFMAEGTKQIIIKAASRQDAAKIWRYRNRLLDIESLKDLAEIIVYACDSRYASGFLDQQYAPTRISKVVYTY